MVKHRALFGQYLIISVHCTHKECTHKTFKLFRRQRVKAAIPEEKESRRPSIFLNQNFWLLLKMNEEANYDFTRASFGCLQTHHSVALDEFVTTLTRNFEQIAPGISGFFSKLA